MRILKKNIIRKIQYFSSLTCSISCYRSVFPLWLFFQTRKLIFRNGKKTNLKRFSHIRQTYLSWYSCLSFEFHVTSKIVDYILRPKTKIEIKVDCQSWMENPCHYNCKATNKYVKLTTFLEIFLIKCFWTLYKDLSGKRQVYTKIILTL